MKSRIGIIFVGFVVLWTILILRAGLLQVVPNQRLQALQNKQFQTIINLQNRRGAIVDKDGKELAMSTKAYSLYADPMIVEKKKTTAKKLSQILDQPADGILQKIKDPKKRFVWLQRLISQDKADQVKALDIRGIKIIEEYRRIYPNENLLAQVIGFTGQEGKGLEGLELEYDPLLAGKANKVTLRRDARGRPLIADGLMFAENPDGAEIKLTVDSDLQYVVESELNQAIKEFEADNAMAVILDAKTSAILALSASPSFDLNQAQKASQDHRRNKPITDTFEPGSTLKTFVIATALKEKIIQPNSKYNTEGGKFKIGDRVIREAEQKEKWAQLSVSEILAYSSNIGTSKIAFDLGPEALRQGLLDFGFGAKSGVELPGEAKGVVQELPWRQHLQANISFGHGIAVSALQMANAYAAIANGGTLNRPYIIQSIRDPETGETKEIKPLEIRKVLSSEDASSLRLMLMGVTAPGGTGVNAKVDGFLVAGKTGTAQKVNPNGRGYLQGAYISSFAGFIPATDPKFVIYVVVDHPKKNAYYGSQVAAPIFSRLASYAARRAGLAPVLLSEKNFIDENLGKPLGAKAKKTKAEVAKSSGNKIENLKADLMPERTVQTISELMPDWKNLSLREVLSRVGQQDLKIIFKGAGIVAETSPAAGEALNEKKEITVYLKNNTSRQ